MMQFKATIQLLDNTEWDVQLKDLLDLAAWLNAYKRLNAINSIYIRRQAIKKD